MRVRDFVGNQPLVERLRRRPLPPASLFAGPAGVGKKTLALSLAALANCKQEAREDLCGRCTSCIKAERGHHPDILAVQPDPTTIQIRVIRNLCQEAHYRPFEGRLRFFIVDQAERMTPEAANSMLKTLEEPPETSCLVLVTAFPDRLLATVRSRCQLFSFRALERREVEAYLKRDQDLDELELRAAFSEGSIGRALALDVSRARQARDLMLEILESWCREASFAALFRHCEATPLRADLRKREAVHHYLEMLQLLVKDLYFLKVNTPARVINRDRTEDLQALAPRLELHWIQDFLYHLEQARRDVEGYVNPLMCFETLWLKNHPRQVDG